MNVDEIVQGLVQELRRGTLILLVLSQMKESTYGYNLVKKLNEQQGEIEELKRMTRSFKPLICSQVGCMKRQSDIIGLIADDSFDITLLLGPMYHLFTVEDQLQALKEAIRVTKKGGILFVAYCGNDASMVQ